MGSRKKARASPEKAATAVQTPASARPISAPRSDSRRASRTPNATAGVIYAVLLGFVVIVSWENVSEAEDVVGQEASALRTMYRDSAAFPPVVREQIHTDVRDYAAAAVEDEWPAMARGEPGSPETARVLDETSEYLATLVTTTRTSCSTRASRPTASTTWSPRGRRGWTSSTRACPRCSGWRWSSAPP